MHRQTYAVPSPAAYASIHCVKQPDCQARSHHVTQKCE